MRARQPYIKEILLSLRYAGVVSHEPAPSHVERGQIENAFRVEDGSMASSRRNFAMASSFLREICRPVTRNITKEEE